MSDRRLHDRLRVGVVGGSIAGLGTAALLSHRGHDVTVLERSPSQLTERGAGLVEQPELVALLRQLGHGERSVVVSHARIVLARDDRILSVDETAQTMLSWDHLTATLRGDLDGASYELGRAAVGFATTADSATVELSDGGSRVFDVIVGADGLHSAVRRAVAPAAAENAYVGYVTWRGLIAEDRVPSSAAGVLFDRFAFFTAPGSHALGYLVPGREGATAVGQRRYNWVWYRPLTASALDALLARSGRRPGSSSVPPGALAPSDLRELRLQAESELPPSFAAAVAATEAPFLQVIYDYVAPQLTRGRLALVGDAAAVVRPHTAMGASKAAGDALTLAAMLDALPVEQALTEYDRRRLPVAKEIADYGVRLGRSLPF